MIVYFYSPVSAKHNLSISLFCIGWFSNSKFCKILCSHEMNCVAFEPGFRFSGCCKSNTIPLVHSFTSVSMLQIVESSHMSSHSEAPNLQEPSYSTGFPFPRAMIAEEHLPLQTFCDLRNNVLIIPGAFSSRKDHFVIPRPSVVQGAIIPARTLAAQLLRETQPKKKGEPSPLLFGTQSTQPVDQPLFFHPSPQITLGWKPPDDRSQRTAVNPAPVARGGGVVDSGFSISSTPPPFFLSTERSFSFFTLLFNKR